MEDITVFISSRESKCDECGAELGRHAWITLRGEKGALCLSCADLDHLAYLPAGDTALTRRSRKYSNLAAVVLKWSKVRKRYERQGLLVEEKALTKAEVECSKDEPARQLARTRAAERRKELDLQYITEFARRVRKVFPNCPPGREIEIAEHACAKYSGRVGRTARAKEFDETAVGLAVRAHIRHTETGYDKLLMNGRDRYDARAMVGLDIEKVMDRWRGV